MPFVPCPSCRRHVRAGDSSCPFCAASLASAGQPVPAASTRLGRGALFAFAVSVAACGGSTETETKDTGVATDTGGPAPAYGAPVDTGVADTGVTDTGGAVAAYGAPPDTGVADTGTPTDDGGPAPAYGLPPSDGG